MHSKVPRMHLLTVQKLLLFFFTSHKLERWLLRYLQCSSTADLEYVHIIFRVSLCAAVSHKNNSFSSRCDCWTTFDVLLIILAVYSMIDYRSLKCENEPSDLKCDHKFHISSLHSNKLFVYNGSIPKTRINNPKAKTLGDMVECTL